MWLIIAWSANRFNIVFDPFTPNQRGPFTTSNPSQGAMTSYLFWRTIISLLKLIFSFFLGANNLFFFSEGGKTADYISRLTINIANNMFMFISKRTFCYHLCHIYYKKKGRKTLPATTLSIIWQITQYMFWKTNNCRQTKYLKFSSS